MNAHVAKKTRGRPASDPDGHVQTREHLIRVGMEIFTRQGFSATGLDLLLKSSNIPKGSFYYYFKSKEIFGLSVIEAYDQYFDAKLCRHLQKPGLTASERLRSFIDDLRSGVLRHEFRRGCLIGNLGQELNVLPDSFRESLLGVISRWERRVATCLEASHPEKAGELARFFWIGWEGAVLRARLARDRTPLDEFENIFMAFIT